jgi:deoxycytidine triphosphate deaminase
MDEDRITKERDRLDHLPCPERDTRESPPTGVLLSNEIKYYAEAKDFKMIDPFKDEHLKPAGYELTIGDEYVMGGERKQLSKGGEIRLPPFNVVVIQTAETMNLPRFLIARWNIRVWWAYKGLLWVGGPQVDPGWVGHLFCPLYNLSDSEVILRWGDPIALMDFVTTTPFSKESVKYDRPPKRVLLEQYDAKALHSALYTLATTRFNRYEERLQQIEFAVNARLSAIQSRVDNFVLITFSVIAVLFAAVTIFVARTQQPSWWNPVPLFLISGTALFLSLSTWIRRPQEQRLLGRAVQAIIITILLAATVIQIKEVRPLRSQVGDLKKQVEQIQQQVRSLSTVPASKPPQATTSPAAPSAPKETPPKKQQ